jgi:uncharacterized protein YbjT (DUF2867 family)
LNFALLAKELDVKHYGLLSSTGADATSMFLYMKTKGRVEQALKDLKLSQLSIYRPGLLLNRRNDSRVGEKIGSWIPFITKIESADMGKAMVEHAVKVVRISDAELADHRLHEMNNAQIIADLRANVKL